MPQKYFDPDEMPEKDRTPCGGYRDDLKFCLRNTDCFKKEKKTMRECLVSQHPSVPEECFRLRTSFFECKRSLLDTRQRFRGRKDV